jgi:hypothetical protein
MADFCMIPAPLEASQSKFYSRAQGKSWKSYDQNESGKRLRIRVNQSLSHDHKQILNININRDLAV